MGCPFRRSSCSCHGIQGSDAKLFEELALDLYTIAKVADFNADDARAAFRIRRMNRSLPHVVDRAITRCGELVAAELVACTYMAFKEHAHV